MTSFELPVNYAAAQWRMPGPTGPPMRVPVKTVFLHHTVTRPTDDPVRDAREVARIGMRRFGRMSYSLLVHPRRAILWGALERVGVHTAGYNSTSIGMALVGDYDAHEVPDELVFDACVALSSLRSFGIVTATPKIRAHREVKSTACPGRHAVERVLPFLRAVAADPSWRP